MAHDPSRAGAPSPLLEPIVQIPVASLIQEHGLEWVREVAHEPILKPASHDLLMLHNYSNIS